VRLLSRTLFIVMALLWVPLTAHCRIASVPGLEFLGCGDHEHSGKRTDQSCEDCGCCSQETAKYHASRWEDTAPDTQTDLTDLAAPGILDLVRGLAPEESEGVLVAAPPPPPGSASWVFLRRLALPVRAPSAAS